MGLLIERLRANCFEDALLETISDEVGCGLLLGKVNGPDLSLFKHELVLSLKDVE